MIPDLMTKPTHRKPAHQSASTAPLTLIQRGASRDAQKVIEEVILHLTSLPNATVEITMEIQAITSDGFPKTPLTL